MSKAYLVVRELAVWADIYGVFSTKALAQEYADALPRRHAAIVEEWELDPPLSEAERQEA